MPPTSLWPTILGPMPPKQQIRSMAKEQTKLAKPRRGNGKIVLIKKMFPILYIVTVIRKTIMPITISSQKTNYSLDFHVNNG